MSMTYLTQLSCLREINLSDCALLSSDGVQGLLKANRRLEALLLSDANRYHDDEEIPDTLIDDGLLKCIGMHCPRLTKLHLRLDSEADYLDLTTESFEAMIKGLPALENVRISDYNCPNTILPMLGLYCPRLKSVYIDNIACCDDDLISMSRGCPYIEALCLHYLDRITSLSMYAIATNCLMLKQLTICSVDGPISDDSMCMLFTHCIHLSSVELHDSPLITNKTILTLLKCCPHLSDLTLISCPRLTDYCILSIPVYCPFIQSLDLWYFRHLSNETIVQISRYCKHIHTMILQGCNKINNNAVTKILKNCKKLTYINIHSSALHITDTFKVQCDEIAAKRRYRTLHLTYSKQSIHSIR